jgi:proteasome accessory factor B
VDNVSRLAGAVTGNRRIRFGYRSIGSGARTQRDVDPYGLGLWRGAWYLVGHCHLRGDVRVFKVARIDGRVQVIGSGEAPAFQVPVSFRLDDHLGREAWDFGDGSPMTVRLRVATTVGGIAAIPGAREVGRDAAAATVDVEVRRPEALLTWILSHGGEVSVVEPESVREQVAGEARRLLACYEMVAADSAVVRAEISPAAVAAGEEPA